MVPTPRPQPDQSAPSRESRLTRWDRISPTHAAWLTRLCACETSLATSLCLHSVCVRERLGAVRYRLVLPRVPAGRFRSTRPRHTPCAPLRSGCASWSRARSTRFWLAGRPGARLPRLAVRVPARIVSNTRPRLSGAVTSWLGGALLAELPEMRRALATWRACSVSNALLRDKLDPIPTFTLHFRASQRLVYAADWRFFFGLANLPLAQAGSTSCSVWRLRTAARAALPVYRNVVPPASPILAPALVRSATTLSASRHRQRSCRWDGESRERAAGRAFRTLPPLTWKNRRRTRAHRRGHDWTEARAVGARFFVAHVELHHNNRDARRAWAQHVSGALNWQASGYAWVAESGARAGAHAERRLRGQERALGAATPTPSARCRCGSWWRPKPDGQKDGLHQALSALSDSVSRRGT